MSEHSNITEFPCEVFIKAIGNKGEAFENAVLAIAHKHFPHIADTAIQMRPSKNSAYLAITIPVHAQSQAQLDAIYKDLSACPEVMMAL